jgi:hypothetical protein
MALQEIDYSPGQDTMPEAYDKINAAIFGINNTTQNYTLGRKVVEIGDWDMDTSAVITVLHAVTDWSMIRGVNALIIADGGIATYPLALFQAGTGIVDGGITGINGTHVELQRRTGGIFDSTLFNATSFNRGFIVIDYQLH